MRKIVIISAAAAVFIALIGGGGYYYFVRRHAPSTTAAAHQRPPRPEFVSLKSMVVNLQPSGSSYASDYGASAYLQVGFKFATTNDNAVEAFKSMQPAIRGNVLDLMLKQPAAVTHSEAARDRMKVAVLKTVNQTIASQLDSSKKDPGFSKVYITRFVTQSE